MRQSQHAGDERCGGRTPADAGPASCHQQQANRAGKAEESKGHFPPDVRVFERGKARAYCEGPGRLLVDCRWQARQNGGGQEGE